MFYFVRKVVVFGYLLDKADFFKTFINLHLRPTPMAAVKNNDFIEVEYTGRLKGDNSVFDTTDKEIAKKSGLESENASYGPVIVCVGEGHLIKGIDKAIVGKEEGKEYKFEFPPEEAFGKKDAKLIQLIPTKKFRQNKIQPVPGLQINIDGIVGTVKTVSGGRTLVDFNHPLAGKEVLYNLRIKRIVNDDNERLLAFLKLNLGYNDNDFRIEINENEAKVNFEHKIPKEAEEQLSNEASRLIPSIRKIVFTTQEEKKEGENK